MLNYCFNSWSTARRLHVPRSTETARDWLTLLYKTVGCITNKKRVILCTSIYWYATNSPPALNFYKKTFSSYYHQHCLIYFPLTRNKDNGICILLTIHHRILWRGVSHGLITNVTVPDLFRLRSCPKQEQKKIHSKSSPIPNTHCEKIVTFPSAH